jgi:hypothetical protein
MTHVVYKGKPPEQRIRDRERNSGGDLRADVRTKQGEGARRTYTNIHHGGGLHHSTPTLPDDQQGSFRDKGKR